MTAIDPEHYTSHPSGIEHIQITEHMNFCLGNAVKYIWRAGLKGEALEDLEKARWYVDREIARLKGEQVEPAVTHTPDYWWDIFNPRHSAIATKQVSYWPPPAVKDRYDQRWGWFPNKGYWWNELAAPGSHLSYEALNSERGPLEVVQ